MLIWSQTSWNSSICSLHSVFLKRKVSLHNWCFHILQEHFLLQWKPLSYTLEQVRDLALLGGLLVCSRYLDKRKKLYKVYKWTLITPNLIIIKVAAARSWHNLQDQETIFFRNICTVHSYTLITLIWKVIWNIVRCHNESTAQLSTLVKLLHKCDSDAEGGPIDIALTAIPVSWLRESFKLSDLFNY